MRKTCPTCGQLRDEPCSKYEAQVNYARNVLKTRGKIWEGCRAAFESGVYRDDTLARMLAEGIIVPADDPEEGYVLPK